MTVWIAMPAYNEGPRLPALLARWVDVMDRVRFPHCYVIVDDGSSDNTAEILEAFASRERAEIITHRPNQGLGASLRDALRVVADRGQADDVVVMMDADNTQPPELFSLMMERMETNECDVVIASRYRPGAQVLGLSSLRRFMSFGARVLFRLVFPISGVRDYTCGYRLYRVGLIQRAFNAYGPRFCERVGFECTVDILLRLAKLGARCREVPMVLLYGEKEGASNMRVGRTVRKTLELMLTRRFERAPRT